MIGIGGENKWVMSLNFLRMSNHQDGDNSSEIRIQESSGGLGFVGTPGNSSKNVHQLGRIVKNGI